MASVAPLDLAATIVRFVDFATKIQSITWSRFSNAKDNAHAVQHVRTILSRLQ
jgi:hypothetical protein